MKSIMKWFFLLANLVCLTACGGGGGGGGSVAGGTPQPTGTSATLRVSVAGVTQPMSGVKATLTLAAGVAVLANADGSVPASSVLVSGVLSSASAALAPGSVSWDPAGRKLSFILYSLAPGGFTAGEFASVACSVTGATPAAAGFSGQLEPYDLSGAPLPSAGVSAAFVLAP